MPNADFRCAAPCDTVTRLLAIYYGGADTVVALAFGYVQELVEWTKANAV